MKFDQNMLDSLRKSKTEMHEWILSTEGGDLLYIPSSQRKFFKQHDNVPCVLNSIHEVKAVSLDDVVGYLSMEYPTDPDELTAFVNEIATILDKRGEGC